MLFSVYFKFIYCFITCIVLLLTADTTLEVLEATRPATSPSSVAVSPPSPLSTLMVAPGHRALSDTPPPHVAIPWSVERHHPCRYRRPASTRQSTHTSAFNVTVRLCHLPDDAVLLLFVLYQESSPSSHLHDVSHFLLYATVFC